MRRVFLAAALSVIAPMPAFAFSVAMDEVHTITFQAPVATVYVGNPAVADINMIDARHAFIIGKGFGNTNIVALDSNGKQVYDSPVSVLTQSARNDSTVVLNRGSQRVTYSCTATSCEATPTPGDSREVFDQINNQLTTHSAAAQRAAGR
jgi:Flp pilus assembly secretin CpaC